MPRALLPSVTLMFQWHSTVAWSGDKLCHGCQSSGSDRNSSCCCPKSWQGGKDQSLCTPEALSKHKKTPGLGGRQKEQPK